MDYPDFRSPTSGEETPRHLEHPGGARDLQARPVAPLPHLSHHHLLLRVAASGGNPSSSDRYRQFSHAHSCPPRERRERPLRPTATTDPGTPAPILGHPSQSPADFSCSGSRKNPRSHRNEAHAQEQPSGSLPSSPQGERCQQTGLRAYPTSFLGYPSTRSRRQSAPHSRIPRA